MKTKILLCALALALVAVFFFWKKRSEPSDAALAPPSPGSAPVKARDLFGKKQAWPVAASEQKPEIPPECEDSWRYLAEMSWQQIVDSLKVDAAPFVERVLVGDCLKHTPGTAQRILELCRKSEGNACIQELSFYRAKIIARLWKHEKDLSKLDSSVLMNMVLAEFSEQANDPANLDLTRAAEIAKALADKEPHLYAAHKALAAGLAINALQGKGSKDSEELAQAFANADRLNQDDTELVEGQLLLAREANDPHFADKVNDFSRRFPNSGVPAYFQAADAWKAGDRHAALQALQQAMQREPTNPRYKKTYEALQKAPLRSKNHFSFDMGFSFNDI